ncbi:TPA: carbon storage regulator [Pseudomonas aeruginosa]
MTQLKVDFANKEGSAMSHLILTRRVGQSIVLTVAPGADPEQALHQLLRDGITVEINRVEHGNVRVSIDAPRTIQIVREELIHS